MKWQKGPLLYEGKAKKVFSVIGDDHHLWLEFKDSLTAFNAQKKGSFSQKGTVNREIASAIFRFLAKNGVRSHWVEDVGDCEMVCAKLKMIPLEVVVRNRVAGSYAKKFNLPEGGEIDPPLVEFYYKDDALGDPFISDDQALHLKAVDNQTQLDELKGQARAVNRLLLKFFEHIGIQLVDFKIELGFDKSGGILLADEITPDSCRLWDLKTGEKLDKDRFRRDLGQVAESYQEVLRRIREHPE